ncbi:phytoene/squalene synthase family protein [Pacificimonas sp. WHA3]|uniref:Phytoene/squalene synthase family protein n=1 Tax=Pacificimonas pallii TaxID=2827236 RepID=A0ABS6SIY2_9SPHN|nr:phytoene/squalene synthase family protein [Pacificimonas pallii]MBV7257896.1 phytoene/squalene synthase family protein [Pacificimonas pallii]
MTTDLDRWAAQSIARGSKSFALASRLFDAETKRRVRLLYAWCRHCDDVVDGQEGGRGTVESVDSALERLGTLRARTAAGLADPASETGAFAAIGLVAAETGLPHELPMRHLDGFAMDAHDRRYRSLTDLLDYCEHVAGVVGRMMAVVMGVAADRTDVLVRAADLGLAFQITNICRDVLEDAANGRCYLPEEMLAARGVTPGDIARPEHRGALTEVTRELLVLADDYYESARIGATHLPPKAAWAVLTAEKVYRAIGHKVRAAGPAAWDVRQHTGSWEKIGMLMMARREAKAAALCLDDRADLWTYGDTPPWREPQSPLGELV